MEYAVLADTDVSISRIALGCWPIAGLTSPGVSDADSLATIRRCFDLGINHLDTAHNYGVHGESERLIAQAVAGRRDEVVIATKGGVRCDEAAGKMVRDARPESLRKQCDTSLQRLATDRIDLYYLHFPDPQVPVTESAGALRDLQAAGKVRHVGASNLTFDELQAFHQACPIAAFQPAYNLLVRSIEGDVLPWCRARSISVMVYWPLLKGLLAGKIDRHHEFAERDSRRKYVYFQGDEWRRNHDLVDELREIAAVAGKTVAQIAVNWTIRQPGVTAALCGAKRPDQLEDSAGAAGWSLPDELQQRLDEALERRGEPAVQLPT